MLKACKKCGVEQPATAEFFYIRRETNKPSGKCKECFKQDVRERRGSFGPPGPHTKVTDALRKCSDCSLMLPNTREHFYFANEATGQLLPQCIDCWNRFIRATYRAQDSSKKQAKVDKNRARYQENPEYWARYKQEWRQRNREKVAFWGRRYRLANPDLIRLYAASRKARKLAAGGAHTKAEVEQKLEGQGRLCYWCQKPIEGTRYHIDHIFPLSKQGRNDIGNLCCACPSCNLRKHSKMPYEFIGRLF